MFNSLELDAYAKSGSVAEEAISGIRTVVAFGCQEKESDRSVELLIYFIEINSLKCTARQTDITIHPSVYQGDEK